MKTLTFLLDIHDVIRLKEDAHLQGILQGEKNVEAIRLAENQEWQLLTSKLRELAEEHGATWDEVNACWKVRITDQKHGSTTEARS